MSQLSHLPSTLASSAMRQQMLQQTCARAQLQTAGLRCKCCCLCAHCVSMRCYMPSSRFLNSCQHKLLRSCLSHKLDCRSHTDSKQSQHVTTISSVSHDACVHDDHIPMSVSQSDTTLQGWLSPALPGQFTGVPFASFDQAKSKCAFWVLCLA